MMPTWHRSNIASSLTSGNQIPLIIDVTSVGMLIKCCVSDNMCVLKQSIVTLEYLFCVVTMLVYIHE